jgi:glutathione S-transferase
LEKKTMNSTPADSVPGSTRIPLTLYYHPLASFCWKALIALYESAAPFEPHIVDLSNAAAREGFQRLWPLGKFPVLRDASRQRTIPESSIVIEYLAQHYPGAAALVPQDATLRLDARLWDRCLDLYVHAPMQKIVGDQLRGPRDKDPHGVGEARTTLRTAYAMLDERLVERVWIVGDAFSIADCAAAPALFYAGIVEPFANDHPQLANYFERLTERPSFARVIAEARPYFRMFPLADSIPTRFLDVSAASV